MKKFLSVILIIFAAGLFTACNTADTEAKGGKGTDTEAIAETEEKTEDNVVLKELKLNGVDISEYKIIYAQNEDKAAIFGIDRARWRNSYDCQRVTASRLVQAIKDNFGVELEASLDVTTEETEYEILVGNTNRSETQTNSVLRLNTDSYKIELKGRKLIICGGAGGSLYHAIDSLENFFGSQTENGVYNITADTELSGEYRLKRVACIGDSITAGSGSSNAAYFSWVAVLGHLEWQEYVVYNYGVGSKTMRSDLADSYQSTEKWKNCLSCGEKYDVVLIMLGTNDSNRDKLWTSDADVQYNRDCRAIVDAVKAGSPDAEFVIMSCPAYYGQGNYGSAHVRELQRELAETMKEEGFKIHFYDMYSYTSVNLGSRCFPDSLHPNDEGHDKIAQAMSEMLGLLAENKKNAYLIM